MAGGLRPAPHYQQGFLGVDWSYDAGDNRYRIARIWQADRTDGNATAPITSPGLNIHVGDAVLAINGQRVGPERSPQELLVNQAGNEVQLTIEDASSKETRIVTAKAIGDERPAR